ncbi:hypothetical protein DMH26_40245, partial [Streptomyces sp. WAC 05379]
MLSFHVVWSVSRGRPQVSSAAEQEAVAGVVAAEEGRPAAVVNGARLKAPGVPVWPGTPGALS